MGVWEIDKNQCRNCKLGKCNKCVDGGGKPNKCLYGCH